MTEPNPAVTIPRARDLRLSAPRRCLRVVQVAGPAGSPRRDPWTRWLEARDREVTVGRTQGPAPWQLDDPGVSRRHFAVTWLRGDDPRVRIRDCGSRNGTFVQGRPVPQDAEGITLELPLVVRVGDSLLVLEVVDADLRKDDPAFGDVVGRVGDEIVGLSGATEALRRAIARLANLRDPVLIRGERGVGKELVAGALHEWGRRSEQNQRSKPPFVSHNCAAIPEALAESTLFGHVKGAFTGAVSDRAGLFEQAKGGTLFLDEIGDLPLALQAKLLRVLEVGKVKRVGDRTERPVDVRVVAATNRDIDDEARFRPDLRDRLAYHTLVVPPLRERPADVAPLAWRFAEEAWGHYRKGSKGDFSTLPEPLLTSDALETLSIYDWPGNVRALKAEVRRAALAARWNEGVRQPIDVEHLSVPIRAHAATQSRAEQPTADELKARLERLGSAEAVARLYGVSRRTIQQWKKELGLVG